MESGDDYWVVAISSIAVEIRLDYKFLLEVRLLYFMISITITDFYSNFWNHKNFQESGCHGQFL